MLLLSIAASLLVSGVALAVNGASRQAMAPASTVDTGALNGAPYRVDIPANWNGELIMLLHGFEPIGEPRPTPKPLGDEAPLFLAAGYAVAQSSYATQGWAVDDALHDNERLREWFVHKHGAPKHTWVVGFSMGSFVVLSSIEHYGRHYDGALALCGVTVPGIRVADDLLTSLVAFDYFYPKAAGLPPGGLADPTAPLMGQTAVMHAVDAALKTNETAAQILARHAHVSRKNLAGMIGVHYLVLRQIVMRANGLPVENRTTVYHGFGDDTAFNRGVHRYASASKAGRYFTAATSLTGRIHTPLVLQYDNDDPLIPARYQPMYPARVKAAHGQPPTTLPSVGEGHCGFSPDQITHAFRALTLGVSRKPSTR